MEKKVYTGEHFSVTTGVSPEPTGTVYYGSSFGDSFQTFAKVTVGEQELSRTSNIDVIIQQQVLSHTHFELLCPSEAFADKNNYPLTHSKNLIGQSLSVQLVRFKQTTAVFEGIVTKVSYLSKDGYPYICLTGKSGTILLDQGKHSRTFLDKTLAEIVESVIKEYQDNRLNVLISPTMKEVIPYCVSYNETDFEFLTRLARYYGEYAYHNGEYWVFGGGDQKRTELFEGQDFQEYSIEMESRPQHFARQSYDLRQDTIQMQDSNELSYPDLPNMFHFKAVENSQKLYIGSPSGHYPPNLLRSSTELAQAVKRKKLSHENTAVLQTKTDNPHLRLGDTMQMNAYNRSIGKHQPIESYRIIDITHEYTVGGYKNTTRAIPFQQQIAPYQDETAYPRAESQFAVVVDNDDKEGLNRLRVRFCWQQQGEQTLWIPLVQGHSGEGQGDHVIPEIGNTLLISFLGDNAEAPVAIGSMYNGSQKSGYHTPQNDLKAFHTRSGTKRVANDAEGSILEEDAAGSFIKLEGDGNITLNAVKDLNIMVGENMNVMVGKNKTENINCDYTLRVKGNSLWVVTGTADMDIKGDYQISVDKNKTVTSNGKIQTDSKGIMHNNSQSKVKNDGGDTTNLF